MCIKVKVEGAGLEQAFNPISTDETPGEVVLLVKVGLIHATLTWQKQLERHDGAIGWLNVCCT